MSFALFCIFFIVASLDFGATAPITATAGVQNPAPFSINTSAIAQTNELIGTVVKAAGPLFSDPRIVALIGTIFYEAPPPSLSPFDTLSPPHLLPHVSQLSQL